MNIEAQRLTNNMIESSLEIQNWLRQFDSRDINTAKSLLCRLQFISRDDYSQWILNKLSLYARFSPCAVYAVRKFRKQTKYLWQKNGNVQPRPAQSQGSEDLVSSIIANANRQHANCFLDHPSLKVLRESKVRHILLIDDSIGSGKRIADFINFMTNHKTFLSWWSYGLITIHVLSYARTRQSEKMILSRVPGSDHKIRKYPITNKLKFDSDIVYDSFDLCNRWGNNSQAILTLCNSIRKIDKDRRRGFGDVMGNIIFYHSVPNNIPGLLYSKSKGWYPLFPNRSLPDWTINLLEAGYDHQSSNLNGVDHKLAISIDVKILLQNIKSGLRTKASLSRRMDSDIIIIEELINQSLIAGLITEHLRLTNAGYNLLKNKETSAYSIKPNYSMYVPKSWCAIQGTVQPFVLDSTIEHLQTDSIDIMYIDGDGGESSLERTDAKATPSPMRDVAKCPSVARNRYIPHGPSGLKE